jgi:hypothetical protein
MEDGIRARIAYVACCLITSKQPGSIYDHHNGQHVNMSGTVSSKKVKAYDSTNGVHFTSTLNGLYDHEKGSHITMEVKGNDVKGYEYVSGSHFSGTFKDSTLTLYDQGAANHYDYIF